VLLVEPLAVVVGPALLYLGCWWDPVAVLQPLLLASPQGVVCAYEARPMQHALRLQNSDVGLDPAVVCCICSLKNCHKCVMQRPGMLQHTSRTAVLWA
jgi:hypothetical protein